MDHYPKDDRRRRPAAMAASAYRSRLLVPVPCGLNGSVVATTFATPPFDYDMDRVMGITMV